MENEEARERLAAYVVEYLEDPNKKAKDLARRKAYEAADPHEKMLIFVNRMKKHYPDFDYEWVEQDKGNVKLTYGDNSVIIKGVDNEGAREEIAHGLRQRQMEIDEMKQAGEQKY